MTALKHANLLSKTAPASKRHAPQPEPVTPGITKGMVRQHAFELYRDKLTHDSLTLEDWVLAEKDLVESTDADSLSR
jgi:hypothetical protein